MPWLQHDLAIEPLTQIVEEGAGDGSLKSKLRRQLNQNRAELFAKSMDFAEKALERHDDIDEAQLVGDHFRQLYGEAKPGGNAPGPPLIGCKAMRPIEARVDLDRVESGGVPLEVSPDVRKPVTVLTANIPARDAEVDGDSADIVWNFIARAHSFREW